MFTPWVIMEVPYKLTMICISMKIKLILTRFGETSGTLRFNEKSFFGTLLGFTPYCGYKPTNAIHADSPGVYTSEGFLNLSTIKKTYLKCDVVDSSFINGIQRILYSFVLIKPPGFNVFCEPETIHYEKIKKSVLNTKYHNLLFRR